MNGVRGLSIFLKKYLCVRCIIRVCFTLFALIKTLQFTQNGSSYQCALFNWSRCRNT